MHRNGFFKVYRFPAFCCFFNKKMRSRAAECGSASEEGVAIGRSLLQSAGSGQQSAVGNRVFLLGRFLPPTVFDILQVCRCADLQGCKCAGAGQFFPQTPFRTYAILSIACALTERRIKNADGFLAQPRLCLRKSYIACALTERSYKKRRRFLGTT